MLSETDEIDWQTKEDELRRHQWKDLLEVPLLLSLLKQLATDDTPGETLDTIKSRYDLYDRAVKHLINAGIELAKNTPAENLLDTEECVREILGRISWAMIRRHDFTNQLQGDAYHAVERIMRTDLLKALQKIDLTTAYQVLDRADNKGLAFRHRSFMEFFAGCHLMGQFTEDDPDTFEQRRRLRIPRDLRSTILLEIHAIVDDKGDFLPHTEFGSGEVIPDRRADWQDTLRFALSHAQLEARNELAVELISLGNPHVVYHAIALGRDGVLTGNSMSGLLASPSRLAGLV